MATQVYYDPNTGRLVDELGNPVDAPTTDYSSSVWAPDVSGAYGYSQSALDNYFRNLPQYQEVGDLSKYLSDVGSYQGYDWQNPLDSYSAPDVEALQGIQDSIYEGRKSRTRERTNRAFQDTQSQVLDEVYRNANRPQQAAALLASLGVEQEAANRGADFDIDAEKASQDMALSQYKYEQNLADEQYRMGINQWLQEQKAAEEQSKYQSQYGLAQDLAQTDLSEYETNRAAQYDRANAQLQGQQAASQLFSQAGTYETNLSEDERKDARNTRAQSYASQGYNMPGGRLRYSQNNYRQRASQGSGYSMPGQYRTYRTAGGTNA